MLQKNFNINNNKEFIDYKNPQLKTTDVNVLLNRVRLDKKKIFKKRLIGSIIFVFLLCSVITYITI